MIEGVEYQWVWTKTPSEQLWGLKGQNLVIKIGKQSQDRKIKNAKIAKITKSWSWKPVRVYNLIALQELVKDDIWMPKVWENWRVMIEGVEYQWVSAYTPSEQLWGLKWKVVLRKIEKQSSQRQVENIRKVKSTNWKSVQVCNTIALQELLWI